VTLTEALAELGLQPGADAETVRRTYLRLIKTRKPESDPEGFRRAREAFEIARGAGEIAFFAAESERRHPPAAPDGGSAAPTSDGDVAMSPPAADPFAVFVRDWEAVPASAGIRARVEIARRAIAALPRDPRPYWLMVQTRSELGTDAEIAEALRAGHSVGWVEFLEALLARVPRLATVAEIDEALRAPSPTLQLLGAAALAPRDPARATSTVVEVVRSARRDAKGEIPISRLLGVILSLHESGASMHAVAAHSEVAGLLRDHGVELALLHGPFGGVWTMAGELAALPLEFPPALRRSFAAATRAGDLQSAFYDACFHARLHRREVAGWVRRTEGVAPNVSATLKGALARERGADRQRSRSRGWVWFAVPCLLAVVRFFASNSGPSPYTHVGSQSSSYYQAQGLPRRHAASPGAPASLPLLTQAGIELCGADWSGPDRLSCDRVREMIEALSYGECERAQKLVYRLKSELTGHPETEAERRLFTSYDLASWQACRRPAPVPAENAQ
jgi:hypothetical protein